MWAGARKTTVVGGGQPVKVGRTSEQSARKRERGSEAGASRALLSRMVARGGI